MAIKTSDATGTGRARPAREELGPDRMRAALAGLLAAAAALAVGELLAGLVAGVPSLVVAVGGAVIDVVPAPVKDFAIAVFGTNDKLALVVGILVLSAFAGAALGIAAARRFWAGAVGIAAFGALGAYTGTLDPQASAPRVVVAAAVAVVAGLGALRWLLRSARRSSTARAYGGATATGRRSFLRAAGVVAGLAALSAATGRVLVRRASAVVARAEIDLPRAAEPLPPPSDAVSVGVDGVADYLTPNATFYRIDTALRVPTVAVDSWRLRVGGMVNRPYELTYDELLDLDQIEAAVTLACVSNEVGGSLVGNAVWQGVPLAAVLDRAGPQMGAEQVVGRSVDGFTVGFPVEAANDGRAALVAVGMNGEPLPLEHGFPARLVVPGLYGYVSATKWLSEIELTTWEGFDAYWVPRGWAKRGPIKTQSRIDVPRPRARIPAGRQPIAGVAWAPTRGIQRVEVQVDDGPWRAARLAAVLGEGRDTWRQWVVEWDAIPGEHRLRVRASDGTGATQTPETAPPAPSGATGWHAIVVDVT